MFLLPDCTLALLPYVLQCSEECRRAITWMQNRDDQPVRATAPLPLPTQARPRTPCGAARSGPTHALPSLVEDGQESSRRHLRQGLRPRLGPSSGPSAGRSRSPDRTADGRPVADDGARAGGAPSVAAWLGASESPNSHGAVSTGGAAHAGGVRAAEPPVAPPLAPHAPADLARLASESGFSAVVQDPKAAPATIWGLSGATLGLGMGAHDYAVAYQPPPANLPRVELADFSRHLADVGDLYEKFVRNQSTRARWLDDFSSAGTHPTAGPTATGSSGAAADARSIERSRPCRGVPEIFLRRGFAFTVRHTFAEVLRITRDRARRDASTSAAAGRRESRRAARAPRASAGQDGGPCNAAEAATSLPPRAATTDPRAPVSRRSASRSCPGSWTAWVRDARRRFEARTVLLRRAAGSAGLRAAGVVACHRIARLRSLMRSMKRRLVADAFRVLQLRRHRRNARRLAAAVERVRDVRGTQDAVQVLLEGGRWTDALDVIAQAQSLLRGELAGVAALGPARQLSSSRRSRDGPWRRSSWRSLSRSTSAPSRRASRRTRRGCPPRPRRPRKRVTGRSPEAGAGSTRTSRAAAEGRELERFLRRAAPAGRSEAQAPSAGQEPSPRRKAAQDASDVPIAARRNGNVGGEDGGVRVPRRARAAAERRRVGGEGRRALGAAATEPTGRGRSRVSRGRFGGAKAEEQAAGLGGGGLGRTQIPAAARGTERPRGPGGARGGAAEAERGRPGRPGRGGGARAGRRAVGAARGERRRAAAGARSRELSLALETVVAQLTIVAARAAAVHGALLRALLECQRSVSGKTRARGAGRRRTWAGTRAERGGVGFPERGRRAGRRASPRRRRRPGGHRADAPRRRRGERWTRRRSRRGAPRAGGSPAACGRGFRWRVAGTAARRWPTSG